MTPGVLFENEPFKSKQDCELNALYRLLPKIKSAFPQLRICIGGDSLYANKNVMMMIKKYNWKYIITFKLHLTKPPKNKNMLPLRGSVAFYHFFYHLSTEQTLDQS